MQIDENNDFDLKSDNGIVKISGHVNFANTPAVILVGQKIIQHTNEDHLEFNFSDLESSNSSILAVLTAWLRCAAEKNIQLNFSSFDKKIANLLELCNFSALSSKTDQG
jgi:anti-anti-sigma regulatory factor